MAPSGGVCTTLLVRVCTGRVRRGLHPPMFVGTCSRFSVSSSLESSDAFSRWFPSAPLSQTPRPQGPTDRRSKIECQSIAQLMVENQVFTHDMVKTFASFGINAALCEPWSTSRLLAFFHAVAAAALPGLARCRTTCPQAPYLRPLPL